jgi:hypothetical protein
MELRKQTNGRTLQALYFKTVDVLFVIENSLNRKD